MAHNDAVSAVVVAQLVSTSAYAGFQWAVHLIIYPQLAEVPPSEFPAYEHAHQRRISYLVGPLFAGLVVTTVLMAVRRPAGSVLWLCVAATGLLLVILAATAFLAVPLHRRLSVGWDRAAHRRLTRVDTVRLVAATANVAVAVGLAAG
jgi:Domain of unknown function (DUF1772)